MASSKAHGYLLFRAYHMQVSLFELFPPLVLFSDTFKDNIGFGGFLKGNHLHGFFPLQLNSLWQQGLANLALKLGEVVG